MAADYTDGCGWGKLDRTAAINLSDVISTFSPRTKNAKARMLLILYASTWSDGTTGMGVRTLAESAGVNRGQADRFIKELKQSGVLVDAGERKTSSGVYKLKRFVWLNETEEGMSRKTVTPSIGKPGKSVTPSLGKPGKSVTHQSAQSAQNACTSCTRADGAAEPPAAHPEKKRPDTESLEYWLTPPPSARAVTDDG